MVNFSRLVAASVGLAAPALATIGGYVYTEGTHFMVDGYKIYFSGSNTYYLHEGPNERVDLALEVAAKHNIQVIRAWAFCEKETCRDFRFVSFENGEAVYHEDAMEKIDYFVAAASQRNIRLVMTFTNNWTDYGGMDEWVKGYGGKYHDDFYTNMEIRKGFKKYIKLLVERINRYTNIQYSDDNTIFSWQLANEPRCGNGPSGLPQSGNCNPDVINEWADDISTYIKELDSNHLVSVGMEGFGLTPPATSEGLYAYTYEDGTDFEALTKLKNVDYNTYHYYAKPWGMKDYVANTKDWIESHQAIGKKYNKPIVFEEWGLDTNDFSIDFRDEHYISWTKFILDADVPMNMFWYTVGADYLGTDGYTLNDEELTKLIDPFTNAMIEKSEYKIKTKSIGKTDLPSNYYKIEGCGELWSQCSNLPTQSGPSCCYHGSECVTIDDTNAQCMPIAPEYRNSISPSPIVIEHLPTPTSDDSCFAKDMGYKCCTSCKNVVLSDTDGKWSIENNEWCGLKYSCPSNPTETCTGEFKGYSCCSSNDIVFSDESGDWGIENNEWCGIKF